MTKSQKKALEYCLRLLGQRAYSEKKLRDKLRQKGYEKEQVLGAISRLKELGFIDDYKFAKDLVENHQQIRLSGRRKIFVALMKKGIDSETAERALDEVYNPDEERGAVKSLINKFSKSIPRDKAYRRLMSRLLSRGYNYGLVKDEVIAFLKEDDG